jgi:hypothetical protein
MARHFALSDFTEGVLREPVTPFIALRSRWFKHGDTKDAARLHREIRKARGGYFYAHASIKLLHEIAGNPKSPHVHPCRGTPMQKRIRHFDPRAAKEICGFFHQ